MSDAESGFYDCWVWDSVEKKWSVDDLDLGCDIREDQMDLEEIIEETVINNLYDADDAAFTRWTSTEFGTKQYGKALLFHGEGTNEFYDDYDRLVHLNLRAICLINIDMPAGKFLNLRRMIQRIVKAGGFGG